MKKLLFTLLMGIFLFPLSQAQLPTWPYKYWKEVAKSLPIPIENSDDQNFGNAIAVSGDYAVVGATGYAGNAGCVYVLQNNLGSWEKLARLTPSDSLPGKLFGSSVAIEGDIVVVGAIHDATKGTEAGAVYIFEKPASGWSNTTEIAKILDDRINGSDEFGNSVAISGDVVVAGSGGYGGYRGGVFVFEKPESGWVDTTNATALLSIEGIAGFDGLGLAVDISGTTIVAGAYGQDFDATNQGALYVYEMPAGGWTDANATAELKASDGAASDDLGRGVAIDGDYIIGGAYADDDGGTSSGSVYLFAKPATGWADMTESAKLTTSDGGGQMGLSVSISGDVVVAGARAADGISNFTGAAYVFQKPAGEWIDATETAKLNHTPADYNDYLGEAVAVSGGVIFVGAIYRDAIGNNSGRLYVYNKPVSGWDDNTQSSSLVPDSYLSANDNKYGYSVALLDSSIAVVGSYGYNGNTGCAYILQYNGTDWNILKQLAASDGAEGDAFGRSVAISENLLAVGAYTRDGSSSEEGVVYLFEKGVDGWADASQLAILTNSSASSGSRLGQDVAIEGGVVVSGTYNSNPAAVLVYEQPVSGWTDMTETARLTTESGVSGDRLGFSLDISDDIIVAGAYNADIKADNAGAVYVFERMGDSWTTMNESAVLTTTDGTVNTYLGYSVAIDDSVIAAGAYKQDNAGAVYLFEKPATGWTDTTQSVKLTASNRQNYDNFGLAVDLEGDYLAVGATGTYYGGSNAGSVFFFEKTTDHWGVMSERYEHQADDIAAGDYFGIAVAIKGKTALIGATGNSDLGPGSGSAYLLKRVPQIIVKTVPEIQYNVCDGDEVQFSYEFENATGYIWLASNDGFHYKWIPEEPPYSGTNTNTLTITAHDSLENKLFTMHAYNSVYEYMGHSEDGDFYFTLDTLPPDILSTYSDLEIEGDENEEAILPDYTLEMNTEDNCSEVSIMQNPEAGTVLSGTDNQVTLLVRDERGNADSIIFNIQVTNTPEDPNDPDDPDNPANGITVNGKANALRLYPNPNNGNFAINFNTKELRNPTLRIISLSGAEVYFSSNIHSGQIVKVNGLKPGLYSIILQSETEIRQTKLFIR